jgi:RNA polymerase sigma-70 factor (ECF subfamily)
VEEWVGEDEEADALAVSLRDGEAVAWEELFRKVYPSMFAFAARRLGSEEGRDAVAETMARAVASKERLPVASAAMAPWLFGILRHVVADAQRRSYRARRLRAWSTSPEMPMDSERLESDEERKALRAAFALLGERDRELLELRVVAGLTVEETGRVLGMQGGAVRTAQSRALARLRKHLAAESSIARQSAEVHD